MSHENHFQLMLGCPWVVFWGSRETIKPIHSFPYQCWFYYKYI